MKFDDFDGPCDSSYSYQLEIRLLETIIYL